MLNVPVIQSKFQEITGYSKAAVDSKCQRRKCKQTGKLLEPTFKEGVHYVIGPDGRRHFNMLVYSAWVRGASEAELTRLADMSDFELLTRMSEANQSDGGSRSGTSRPRRKISSTPAGSVTRLKQKYV